VCENVCAGKVCAGGTDAEEADEAGGAAGADELVTAGAEEGEPAGPALAAAEDALLGRVWALDGAAAEEGAGTEEEDA
jgi:hypothetical protein